MLQRFVRRSDAYEHLLGELQRIGAMWSEQDSSVIVDIRPGGAVRLLDDDYCWSGTFDEAAELLDDIPDMAGRVAMWNQLDAAASIR